MTDMEDRMNRLEDLTWENKYRQTDLDKKVDQISNKIDKYIDINTERMKQIDERMDKMDERMNRMDARMDKFEAEMKDMKLDMNDIRKEIRGIGHYVNALVITTVVGIAGITYTLITFVRSLQP